jgi:RNA polymerase sigma-70 factor (ECF subfamily)
MLPEKRDPESNSCRSNVMSAFAMSFGFAASRPDDDACASPNNRTAHRSKPADASKASASRAVRMLKGLKAELCVKKSSDEALLAAYMEGDREAFHELMERYSNELLQFLTRFLGSRAAGEDVFQETFLQIHLSADTFDPSRRFKPWLFTIAANKARDYHRKHKKRTQVSLSASVGSDDDGQRFVDLLEADLPSPDAPILDAERSRLVKSVMDSMPAHLREILLLSYFQKLSYNQIADALEIPLGTVKSRLHSAVASFAGAWKASRASEGIRGNNREGGVS